MPRNCAISFDSCGCALPAKTFSSPNPVLRSPSPLRGRLIAALVCPRTIGFAYATTQPTLTSQLTSTRLVSRVSADPSFALAPHPQLSSGEQKDGWGGRIRTFEYGIQSPAPYRLATPQHTRPTAPPA